MATERGYDEAEGVELEIRKPGASTDALKLLQAGRADMAILDIHDLGLARLEGADIVGVMAFVQRPLAAVLAQPSIRSPADLEGQRAGVSGLPSDDAVLRSIVEGDGGDPDKVRIDDDRVPGRQGAAGRAASRERRRSGTSRASRCASSARACASSASTTTARRAIRSWCCA